MRDKELEKEINELVDYLDNLPEEEFPENYENLSEWSCDCCGTRMTLDEYCSFESTCEECTWSETSGLIDDETDKELLEEDEPDYPDEEFEE